MPKSRIPQRIAARRAARRRQLRRQRLGSAGLVLILLAGTTVAFSKPFSSSDGPAPNLGLAAPGDEAVAEAEAGEDAEEIPAAQPLTNARTQPGWRQWTGPVPILMYHVISDPAPDAPYPDLYLAADDFRAQVDWLADQGYEAVTLRQVSHAWWHDGRLPEKPIVLSFDDGYVSHYEVAYAVMRDKGWPGLLNLKAGESDIYKRQVREMVAAGWELGSHTVDHPDLTQLDATSLADELNRSRRILRRRFKVPVDHLCYPAGRYDDTVVAAAEAAGYSTASTTDPGLASPDDPYRLKRIRINRGDGPEALAAAGI